jgi:hypothetical protein
MMATSALSDFTKMPVMPKLPKLEALTQPEPTPKGMLGPVEVGPVLSELGSAESEAALAVGQRDIDIEQAKREEKATEARMKAENLATFSEEVKAMPERKTLEQARQEMSTMAFVPTKDTATDLAAMFSLINIVGMLVGKSDAQRSMYAMNGMLEGYQKGRADLYKKEQVEFDKNFKAMQAKVATLEKALTEAMEVKKYDKEKGELLVTMALAEADSQVLKAMRVRQGDVAVLENVRKARKDFDTLVGINNTLVKDANARADAAAARAQADRIAKENRAAADERARLGREQQKALAELKAGQPGKQGQNALTFASRVYGNIENATNDLVNLTNLPAVAESPIFAGMIGADRETVLRNITAFAARKVTNKDQRAFEQIANSLDAALARLEAQGLANGSTRGAIASFSALKPREGDDAINMAIYLARVKQEIETGIKVHGEMPGATPGQKQNNVRNIERINKTVPFSVEDTLDVLKANRKPLGKKMEQLLTQPQIVPNVSMEPQAQQQKPMPSPEKLKAYADKNFGGDVNQATSYLQSQGYK